jgi:hypothetical protein
MKPLTITMSFKKSTKNSHQFEAEGVIPTLYIKKSAFPEGVTPTSVIITVKEV